MNLTRDRLRSIGWVFILTLCCVLTLALTFRVNAVKSQVRLTERQIVSIKQEKLFLETEFETRANQQQLTAFNDVDFGYKAPTAGQYLEGERQLAALGKPAGPGAPTPIRVASAVDTNVDAAPFVAMVSPLTGKAEAAVVSPGGPHKPTSAAQLRDRLSHIDKDAGDRPVAGDRKAARE